MRKLVHGFRAVKVAAYRSRCAAVILIKQILYYTLPKELQIIFRVQYKDKKHPLNTRELNNNLYIRHCTRKLTMISVVITIMVVTEGVISKRMKTAEL